MHHLLSLLHDYALPFIIVISVVVFVHEYGHFWVARRCGIRVESFSIGFGKSIFGWTDKHGTRWQVAWLPLGGYVKMFGDADPASSPDEAVKHMTEEEKRISFFHQSVSKRMAVVVAGPVTNYIFAIVVLAFLFVFEGQPFSPAIVSSLQDNSVAAHAGLLPGDKIVQIDDTKIERFEDIKRMVAMSAGAPLSFIVERNDSDQTFTLTPEIAVMKDRFGGEHKMGKIGIVSDKLDHRKLPPLQAIGQAAVETWNMSADTLKAIGQMIMGTRGSEEIGGPLRIAEMSGDVAKDGFWAVIWFMGVISINLGLINLFPVPLLDGGHLLFYFYEAAFGKPLGEKVQEAGLRVGMALVLSLMVFATWNDLVHLEVISKIKSLFS